MEFDERRKLIVSILRLQDETKTLISGNAIGNHDREQSRRITELQNTIQSLREEKRQMSISCNNLSQRRIQTFSILSKVVIEAMRSERACETHNTLDVVLRSQEFLELFREMTHVAFKNLTILDCVTSILLELSLSPQGRKRVHDLKLCQFVSALFARNDLTNHPSILYRLFNTVLNMITLHQPSRPVFSSRETMGNLKRIEKAVSRDAKLSNKLRALMDELGKGQGMMRSSTGSFMKFGSPQPRGYQRRAPNNNVM